MAALRFIGQTLRCFEWGWVGSRHPNDVIHRTSLLSFGGKRTPVYRHQASESATSIYPYWNMTITRIVICVLVLFIENEQSVWVLQGVTGWHVMMLNVSRGICSNMSFVFFQVKDSQTRAFAFSFTSFLSFFPFPFFFFVLSFSFSSVHTSMSDDHC